MGHKADPGNVKELHSRQLNNKVESLEEHHNILQCVRKQGDNRTQTMHFLVRSQCSVEDAETLNTLGRPFRAIAAGSRQNHLTVWKWVTQWQNPKTNKGPGKCTPLILKYWTIKASRGRRPCPSLHIKEFSWCSKQHNINDLIFWLMEVSELAV